MLSEIYFSKVYFHFEYSFTFTEESFGKQLQQNLGNRCYIRIRQNILRQLCQHKHHIYVPMFCHWFIDCNNVCYFISTYTTLDKYPTSSNVVYIITIVYNVLKWNYIDKHLYIDLKVYFQNFYSKSLLFINFSHV